MYYSSSLIKGYGGNRNKSRAGSAGGAYQHISKKFLWNISLIEIYNGLTD